MNLLRRIPVLAIFAGLGAVGLIQLQSVKTNAAPINVAKAAPSADVNFAPIDKFLKDNCLECHNATKQKGDLALHTYHDGASILKDRKTWETVLEKVQAGDMPPKKKARPSPTDLNVFTKTVAEIFDRHDRMMPPDPGRVTVRRLNRTEYDNTIRDLCYVDANASEDFPTDDVGQGFDNIGDVLSMSPVLMERYLSAAEMIMNRAIPKEMPKQLKHYMAGLFLEPGISELATPKGQGRPLDINKTLVTRYIITLDGEWSFGFNVYADDILHPPPPTKKPGDKLQPGSEKSKKAASEAELTGVEPKKPVDFARVGILLDGKEVAEIKIDKGTRKSPMLASVKKNLTSGEHVFTLLLKHVPDNEAGWKLRVRNFAATGPPDTRPMSMRRLLARDESASKAEQARVVLKRFASRAYRRPATNDEINHLLQIESQAEKEMSWEQAVGTAMQAVLVSPKFLFRVELDDRPDSAAPHELDEYQLASRLSYFLWGSMPDDELTSLAEKKSLSANIEAQVKRMLKDKRADSLVDSFAIQWLQLRRLRAFSPDTNVFREFDERLRASMLKETQLFIGAVIHEDRSILDLVDSDFTFLDARLARFYKIADTNGNPLYQKAIAPKGEKFPFQGFVRVHLADHLRGGLLTQASILCVTSNPTRTSPVKRGKFVLEQILGVPPPAPPANVPPLEATKAVSSTGKAMSLRQRLEIHRADPTCANCHEKMDSMGFAFENYNAVGQFRKDDDGAAIDPSGSLPNGSPFNGAVQLKALLREQSPLFARSLSKKLLIYALGRGVEYYDQPAVNKIVNALEKNQYKFSTLAIEIAKSEPFRMRRGKEQNP